MSPTPPRRLPQEAREALGWADRGDEEGPDEAPTVTEGQRPYTVRCRATAMDWTFTVHAHSAEEAFELASERSHTDDVEIISIGREGRVGRFEHVIELRIVTTEANPDMPSININTLAAHLRAVVVASLTSDCFLSADVQESARRVS